MIGQPPDPREPLGRLVHDVRLACEADRTVAERRQKFNLPPWEGRDDWQRELDMRIGAAVAAAEAERIAACIDALAAASGGPSHFAYRNAAHVIRQGQPAPEEPQL